MNPYKRGWLFVFSPEYSVERTSLCEVNTFAIFELSDTLHQIFFLRPELSLKLLQEFLKSLREGKPISIIPLTTEVTTQAAAEILGCSRPHLVKLLGNRKIEFSQMGKVKRIKLQDLLKYRNQMKDYQKKQIIAIMNSDEETGLYDL